MPDLKIRPDELGVSVRLGLEEGRGRGIQGSQDRTKAYQKEVQVERRTHSMGQRLN